MSRAKNKVVLSLKRRKTPKNIPNETLATSVPYFSQWESPELIGEFLSGYERAEDDPNWKRSGAKTKKEYAEWSHNGCGMACLKMVLAERGISIPIVELGKLAASFDVYTLPVGASSGLRYTPFVKLLKERFGIRAKVIGAMNIRDVILALAHQKLVIASVSPQIRDPSSTPKSKGGHLILILGYNLNKEFFYIHNPSGTKKHTQDYAKVSFKDFKKFFANRGIVIDRSK